MRAIVPLVCLVLAGCPRANERAAPPDASVPTGRVKPSQPVARVGPVPLEPLPVDLSGCEYAGAQGRREVNSACVRMLTEARERLVHPPPITAPPLDTPEELARRLNAMPKRPERGALRFEPTLYRVYNCPQCGWALVDAPGELLKPDSVQDAQHCGRWLPDPKLAAYLAALPPAEPGVMRLRRLMARSPDEKVMDFFELRDGALHRLEGEFTMRFDAGAFPRVEAWWGREVADVIGRFTPIRWGADSARVAACIGGGGFHEVDGLRWLEQGSVAFWMVKDTLWASFRPEAPQAVTLFGHLLAHLEPASLTVPFLVAMSMELGLGRPLEAQSQHDALVADLSKGQPLAPEVTAWAPPRWEGDRLTLLTLEGWVLTVDRAARTVTGRRLDSFWVKPTPGGPR